MAKVAVVVVEPLSPIKRVVLVSSFTQHDQPLVAVEEFPIVITTEQVLAPKVNFPAVAPPTVVPFEHPEAVNFVPALTKAAPKSLPDVFPAVPFPRATFATPERDIPVSIEPAASPLAGQPIGSVDRKAARVLLSE